MTLSYKSRCSIKILPVMFSYCEILKGNEGFYVSDAALIHLSVTAAGCPASPGTSKVIRIKDGGQTRNPEQYGNI